MCQSLKVTASCMDHFMAFDRRHLTSPVLLPSVLWRCWRQKGHLARKKTSGGVLAWLCVWSEMQTCTRPSWCHCHSLPLASVKSRLVLPFWYRLTRVVREKGPLNGVCVCDRRYQCASPPYTCFIQSIQVCKEKYLCRALNHESLISKVLGLKRDYSFTCHPRLLTSGVPLFPSHRVSQQFGRYSFPYWQVSVAEWLARLTAVWEDPGSNHATDSCVYREGCCNIQSWARAVHLYCSA